MKKNKRPFVVHKKVVWKTHFVVHNKCNPQMNPKLQNKRWYYAWWQNNRAHNHHWIHTHAHTRNKKRRSLMNFASRVHPKQNSALSFSFKSYLHHNNKKSCCFPARTQLVGLSSLFASCALVNKKRVLKKILLCFPARASLYVKCNHVLGEKSKNESPRNGYAINFTLSSFVFFFMSPTTMEEINWRHFPSLSLS